LDRHIEFQNIGKSFPGVRALNDISFRAEGGKVTALLGENGAGKSTLLKIMSGDLASYEGAIILDGTPVSFESPYHAITAGVSVIYQERQLIPELSVMENLFAGELPANRFGVVDWDLLRRETEKTIEDFEVPFRPDDLVGSLSIAYQQMIEIMKVYRRNSQVIAFDEPTAPLADSEISVLFKLIHRLRDEGKVILYVSHRLAEIFEVADAIVVLKDGELVSEFKTSETDENELIRTMVGRDIGDTYATLKRNTVFGEVLLEVSQLVTPYVNDVTFTLRRGEIIGLAGLVGAGRTEVARAIFGADPVISGEIRLDGQPVRFRTPKQAIRHGIALCPEDRKDQGLVLFRSIKDNVCMPILDKLTTGLFLDEGRQERLSDEAVRKYSIKTPTTSKSVVELSGGNQQKVILGRWTSDEMMAKLLILDEPTKGIDVGTKAEIYQMICDFAKQGMGVILISSELTEIINLADTVIVMYNGRVTGQVKREDATEENVLALAMKN
jgi:ABC-type sugar transport system ATPase subunit